VSNRPGISAHRRRARKKRLAERYGRQCFYCRRPFRDLREATADHIVPVSLWRSWSMTSLMLACRPCNEAKADRFPLLLALTLCAAFPAAPTGVNDPSTPVNPTVDAPTVHVDALTVQAVGSAVHGAGPVCRPAAGEVDSDTALTSVTPPVTAAVTPRDTGVSPGVSRGVSPVSPQVGAVSPIVLPIGVWRLLARLALAQRPVFTAVWRPDPIHERSTPHLHESTRHTRRTRVVSTRPACLRAPRPGRACAGPTGEAVPA